jgi:hypothetical protein
MLKLCAQHQPRAAAQEDGSQGEGRGQVAKEGSLGFFMPIAQVLTFSMFELQSKWVASVLLEYGSCKHLSLHQ